jgi:serine/threonine protein kinase
MPHQRFDRVRALFLAALRQPDAESGARFLAEHAGDARAEVETLLHSHQSADGFLEMPPVRELLAGLDVAMPALPQASFHPGDRVGDFRIVTALAHGGFGTVYRAEQLSLGRQVALKVIASDRIDAADRRRAVREMSLAAAIDSPHLVRVYAGGEDTARGVLYLAMRLVEGPDLAAMLAQRARCGTADPAGVRRLVARCAEAGRGLAALHAHGLVHRDVKPKNIMLESGAADVPGSGVAVVVDLGLVRAVATDSTRSVLAGTLAYLAPEVLAGQPAGCAADVFALGLVLFDAVSGIDPAARTPGAQPPWLRTVNAGVSPDLEAIVACATMPRAAARYRDAQELVDDLERWLVGVRVRARRVQPLRRALRWVREHPKRAVRRGGLAAGSILLVALLADHAISALTVARRMRKAMQHGQLAAYVALLPRVPAWAASWLGVGVADAPEEAVSVERRALREVLAAVSAREETGALVLATRYLQRDRVAAHPHLAAFLAAAVREDRDGEGDAARLCSRLFQERPDASPADVAASAYLRSVLEERLRRSDCELFTLSALGGCGDVATLALLAVGARQRGADASGDAETVRLTYRAMLGIAERSATCGFDTALAALDHEQLLARAARHVGGWCPGDHLHPSQELASLAARLALARRRVGVPPGNAVALRALGPLPPVLLAAQLDPHARMAVAAFPGGAWTSGLYQTMEELGQCVGFLADAAVAARARSAIPAFARAHELEEESCVSTFDSAAAAASAELAGRSASVGADSWSRLAAGLDPAAAAWRPLPTTRAASSWLAGWDMVSSPVRQHGASHSATGRSVRIQRDEYVRNCNYVALVPTGMSTVDLALQLAERADDVDLAITMQKSVRAAMPYGGEAFLKVRVDGEDLAHHYPVRANGQVTIVLPLAPLAVGPHTIAIELAATSTTALRLYDVKLRRRQ